jgi:hypothetical protein
VADEDGAKSTTLFVNPGITPPLRLRATPVLAKPGENVTVELLRGPEYSGELPKTEMLTLRGVS